MKHYYWIAYLVTDLDKGENWISSGVADDHPFVVMRGFREPIDGISPNKGMAFDLINWKEVSKDDYDLFLATKK